MEPALVAGGSPGGLGWIAHSVVWLAEKAQLGTEKRHLRCRSSGGSEVLNMRQPLIQPGASIGCAGFKSHQGG